MEKKDFLWRVIHRYDTYIDTTNSKAAFLIAWNTFLFGTLVVKSADFAMGLSTHPKLQGGFWTIAVMLAISCLASLWFTFKVVNPFLSSPRKPMDYHSLIFFCHVAELDESKYLTEIESLTEDKAVRDLAFQANVLAKGTTAKFTSLKLAIGIILIAQIPAIAALLFILTTKYFIP